MSNQHQRDRGNLFENGQKKKPSQPDLSGDCSLDGKPYEIQAWRRDEQLTITFAPPRGDSNKHQQEAFRGVLEAGATERTGKRGASEAEASAAWIGDIKGDEASYTVSAFEKQGKSGAYFTLSFARLP